MKLTCILAISALAMGEELERRQDTPDQYVKMASSILAMLAPLIQNFVQSNGQVPGPSPAPPARAPPAAANPSAPQPATPVPNPAATPVQGAGQGGGAPHAGH